MIRTGWLAALALLAGSPLVGLGQFGGPGGQGGMMGGGMLARGTPPDAEEWTVKVEGSGNQAITGRLRLATLAVQCDLGLYEIRPEKIKEIQFMPAAKDAPPAAGAGMMMGGQAGAMGVPREAVVMTASGEKIAGTLAIPPWWRVRTDEGVLTPDAQRIRSIALLGRAEPDPAPKRAGPTGGPNPGKPNPAPTEAPK